ncbi:MAG: HXXEE domain-containing protein [Gemmatimonadaceae bacterium]
MASEGHPGARRWAMAWATLCVAFALHVIDEATHDFLSWYNPNALALRARVPWLPVPVFTFRVWITGLTAAVLAVAALTPLVRRGRRWLVPVAYVYGVIHVANGIGHITVSIAGRWLAPGVYSSPLLIASAVWLLYETERWRRRHASPADPPGPRS